MPAPAPDQRVRLHGVSWADYEALLVARGDRSPRISYLRGELEILHPSWSHERIKSTIGRLVVAWAEDRGLTLTGAGSWTLRSEAVERGLEPDECYVLGAPVDEPERPDLAIEVVWTSGGIDKLEIYRGLRVPEVWRWIDGRIDVHVLEGDAYALSAASRVLVGIDLRRLAVHAVATDPTAAVRAWRREL